MRTPPFTARGWTGLALYVLAYDTWALATRRDTLSTVFRRSVAHPIRRWPVILTCAVTILHLFGRLPDWIDPFHQYGTLLARVSRRERIVLDLHISSR